MEIIEYISIGIAIAVVVLRAAMFLPRQAKA